MRVKTEAKRDAIVAAASEVFLKSGYEGASMSEIAARVGGSKATLYSYFKSKDELFVAVINATASKQFEPIFAALGEGTNDLPTVLQRFGESTLRFLCTQPSIQMRRAILAESGRSDIGRRFFEIGPRKGMADLATFLEARMDSGQLEKSDPMLASVQLLALLECETVMPMLYGVAGDLSDARIRLATRRAVQLFLKAYATASR